VQALINLAREVCANAGYRLEQMSRIQISTQAFKLCPVSCRDYLRNSCGNTLANAWQCDQSLAAILLQDFFYVLFESTHCFCGAAIGAYAERIGTLLL